MATTFYFSDNVSSYAPTSGTKSAVLPTGSDNSLTTNDSQSLLLTTGATDTTVSITSLAQTATQSGRFARFTSDKLSAQTITAQTWTYQLRNREGNNSANAYKGLSIYIWRPSTNSVVGYIYDSTAQIGTEWTTNYTNDVSSISGSSVTCSDQDVLVNEVWYIAAQAKSVSYILDIQYNINSFIETPQNLTFYTSSRYLFFT